VRTRRFRAPGKLVLLGEYAALDGGPSLVAALEHGVECAYTDTGRPRSLHTPQDDRFVAACLDALEISTGTWHFSDWNPLLLNGKPGFGGSAAATVTAILAGTAHLGETIGPRELYQRSQAVHHRVQGSGSGIDVAAAVYGGVLEFADGEVSPRPPLPLVAVWSGRSARTAPRLEAYLRWPERRAFTREMSQLVRGFYGDPVAAMAEGSRLLSRMADRANIPYLTQTLSEVQELAEAHHGAAKPSGAGGGDCAVAVFNTEEQRHDFEKACTRRGLIVIPISIAAGATEIMSGRP
jgi:phosphomevalonate kinase